MQPCPAAIHSQESSYSVPATELVTTRPPSTPLQTSFSVAIEALTEAHGAAAMAKFPEIAHYHATK